MSKTHLILGGLALLQIVLLLIGGSESTVSTEGVSEPGVKPFEDIEMSKVASIEITDEDATRIVIARQESEPAEDDAAGESKESWGVATVGGFPVRSDKPGKLLDDLKKATLGRVLTRKAENLARLEVADERFARHILVKDAQGGVISDFYIGEGERYDEVNFRRAGESVAYMATGLSTFSFGADVGSWIETGFTEYDDKKVGRVSLTRGDDVLVIEKKTREKPAAPDEKAKDEAATDTKPTEKPEPETEDYWVVVAPEADKGKELDKSKAESLVRGLCRIYLGTALGKVGEGDHGFDQPTATAVLTIEGEEPQTITVGKQREGENDFAAMRTGFDYVVTLRNYTIDDYFKKKLADLLPEKEEEEESDEGK